MSINQDYLIVNFIFKYIILITFIHKYRSNMKGMVKIRERQNNYGVLVALLLIIIMVLISYIAYSKGLEKNNINNESTTTTTEKIKDNKINKLYSYEELCGSETDCNKEIVEFDNLKIDLKTIKEDDILTHNLVFSGKVDKIINLKRFINIQVLDSQFLIIEEQISSDSEDNSLLLYDINLTKLDTLVINNLLDKSFNGLEMIYYTYDQTCKEKDNKYYLKNSTLIGSNGFNLINSIKGPLKEKGFIC